MGSPRLVVLSSTIVRITWSAPLQPNGALLGYRVYKSSNRLPYSLYVNVDISTFYTTDNSLVPLGTYSYIVEAYSLLGATNSSAVTVIMPLASPSNIPPPANVTVISSREINVVLNVSTISESVDQYIIVLNPGSINALQYGIGLKNSATLGGLQPYSIYSVHLSACLSGMNNGCGIGAGVSVRTFEASPQGQQPPTLAALGPQSISVRWQPPLYQNGRILKYIILRTVVSDNSTINGTTVDATVFEYIDNGLAAYTTYAYSIVVINSVGNMTSSWTSVTTLIAAPMGLTAPAIVQIYAREVLLTWLPPQQANGPVLTYSINYHSVPSGQIPLNSVTVSGNATAAYISGLSAYTMYQFSLVADNGAGMVSSGWSTVTTAQTAPANIAPFLVEQVSSGNAVILTWNVPLQPNGIISNYRVYGDASWKAMYEGIVRTFEYTGLQPYSAYKVQLEACTPAGCARGNVQTVWSAEIMPNGLTQPSITFISATLVVIQWTPPLNANGKILNYNVYRKQLIGYSSNLPIVVYSTNDTSTSTFSYYDNTVRPNSYYLYQVEVINSKGNALSPWINATTFQAAPDNVLSPNVTYIVQQADRLLITWSDPLQPNGIIVGYNLYRNGTLLSSLSPSSYKYTDSNLLAFTYYSYSLSACTAVGCTDSQPTLIQTLSAPPQYMDAPSVTTAGATELFVTWTRPNQTNGIITNYNLIMDNSTIYTGLTLSFVVSALQPYRPYSFQVSCCTVGGCTVSSPVTGQTSEAPPTNMLPPVLYVLSSTSIEITWRPPLNANGIITMYQVSRNGSVIEASLLLQFIDYGLLPAVSYYYTITAFNSKGNVQSVAVIAATYPSAPVGLAKPQLVAVNSSAILAVWKTPVSSNGVIVNYTLFKDSLLPVYVGLDFSFTLTNLDPWTIYQFRVQACTSRGCVVSDFASVRTLEAPPFNFSAPSIIPGRIDNNQVTVLITWLPPTRPNGLILGYAVFRRVMQNTGKFQNI